MIALVSTGQCYGVGYNKSGALGITGSAQIPSFTLIPTLQDITFIAAGQNISMFIDKNQKLLSAGCALLHGNHDKNSQPVPAVISTFAEKSITHVACGYVHCAAVDSEGKLYTWGSNVFFQLGHGDNVRES